MNAHLECVPKQDHERTLAQIRGDSERKIEQERSNLFDALNRKMREFELNLRTEYEQKIDFLERKAAENQGNQREMRELKGEMTAKNLTEEVLRRQFENRLNEETGKLNQAQKEIARLMRLQQLKSDTESDKVTDLRKEIETLTEEIEIGEVKIRKMTEIIEKQTKEIATLTGKLETQTGIEEDYAALAKELTELKLKNKLEIDGNLKVKLQEMESANSLLQRDFDTLATMHKRALKELKSAPKIGENSFKMRVRPSSPLKRNFDSTETSFPFPSSETTELRKFYDRKCLELSEDALRWKEKTRLLVSRYFHALEKLQRENKQVKSDLESFKKLFNQQISDLSSTFERKIREKSQSSETKISRKTPQSVERIQRYVTFPSRHTRTPEPLG